MGVHSEVLVRGVDFTSAPKPNKPITLAECSLVNGTLLLREMRWLSGFREFERALAEPGAWIMGCDFPFGQSRKLVENLGWPGSWPAYVEYVGSLTSGKFVALLEDYKAKREKGDKEHRRVTDVVAGSISPQKLYGVPVGRMFFRGAPRILRSPANIPLLRPNDDPRVVVEAYPKLVAMRWCGRRSYKSDDRNGNTQARRQARADILEGVTSPGMRGEYGFEVRVDPALGERMVDEAGGDALDAMLCAIQAAWAHTRRADGYGIPSGADPLEGWIVDPGQRL